MDLRPGQWITVRDVAWDEIVVPDARKRLEIASLDYDDEDRRLEAMCECGAHVAFVRAEACMRRPDTCCCGGCRVPVLVVTGACPGCGCLDCAAAEPCPLIGEEMGYVWEGEEARLFFEPVPVARGS